MILDHEDEDYWRDFGKSRETLVAPSLAWYGEDTTVNLSYEHREFTTPFDRGTAIDPRTNRPLDIPRSRRLDEPFNITEGRSEPDPPGSRTAASTTPGRPTSATATVARPTTTTRPG